MIRLDNAFATVTPAADRVIGSPAPADRTSCNADLQGKNVGKHSMGSNRTQVGVRMYDLLWVKHNNKVCDMESTPII